MIVERKIGAHQRERKRMGFALDLKSVDSTGRFAGYASVFDIVDNQRDVMLHGAFANTIGQRTHSIKLLWQHRQDEPIGVFERMFEDEHGLYVEGRLLLDVTRATEALALLKARAINGLSIGYTPLRYHIDSDTGIRYLAEVELWEISLVTFPANQAANITVVKQSGEPFAAEEQRFWQEARNAGQLIELSQALDRAVRALQF